jgi:hypothetical protein
MRRVCSLLIQVRQNGREARGLEVIAVNHDSGVAVEVFQLICR